MAPKIKVFLDGVNWLTDYIVYHFFLIEEPHPCAQVLLDILIIIIVKVLNLTFNNPRGLVLFFLIRLYSRNQFIHIEVLVIYQLLDFIVKNVGGVGHQLDILLLDLAQFVRFLNNDKCD